MKTLAEYLAAERRRRQITAAELAVLAGYKRINKGVRRISTFEITGQASRSFVERVFAALDLSVHAVENELERLAASRSEDALSCWIEEHGDDDPPPHLIVRCFAGFYSRHDLIGRLSTTAGAVAYARSLARRTGLQVVLPLGDGRWASFDEHGRVANVAVS